MSTGGFGIGAKLVGKWDLAKKVLRTAPAAFDRALKATIGAEAERIAGNIRKRIANNVPPPNAPSTVQLKGSSKTLIASGEMQKTVQVIWRGKFQAFVGIPASASKSAARLADIHENGRVIVQQMTDKQRRFLHALFKSGGSGGAGTGIIVIHIPARPFMRPVFEEYNSGGKREFLDVLEENLDGWAHGV
jgi:hypothetical protein